MPPVCPFLYIGPLSSLCQLLLYNTNIRFEGESRNNIIFTATVRTFGTSGDWILLDNGTYTYTVNNNLFSVLFWENTYVNSSRTILQAAFGYDYLGQKNYSPAIRFTVDTKDGTVAYRMMA